MNYIKLNLSNIKYKLSRIEMKKIMAGSGPGGGFADCCVMCPGNVEKCTNCGNGVSSHCKGTQGKCGESPWEELCPIS